MSVPCWGLGRAYVGFFGGLEPRAVKNLQPKTLRLVFLFGHFGGYVEPMLSHVVSMLVHVGPFGHAKNKASRNKPFWCHVGAMEGLRWVIIICTLHQLGAVVGDRGTRWHAYYFIDNHDMI